MPTLVQRRIGDAYCNRVFGALALLIGVTIFNSLGDRLGVPPVLNLGCLLYALAGVTRLVLLSRIGVDAEMAAAQAARANPEGG